MYKVSISNSIIGKKFENLEFSKKVFVKGEEKKCINLIYAPNGVGKSSTSLILHSKYNSDIEVINHFDNNKKSNIDVIVDDYAINQSFRYDKSFAINSVSLYEGNLIISPENAVELSNLENKKSIALDKLVKEYKATEICKSLVLYNNSKVFKGTILEKFSLKSPNKQHSDNLYIHLKSVMNDTTECSSLTIDELIDIGGLADVKFISRIKSFLKEIDNQILDDFPEIDRMDYRFFKIVHDYMFGNKELIDKICVMCGETTLTKELIDKRLKEIKKSITNYSEKEKGNELLEMINQFILTDFLSEDFKFSKTLAISINKENIYEKLLEIDKLLSKHDFNIIGKKFLKCILIKIHNIKEIKSIIASISSSELSLEKMYKKNKNIINSNVKLKFITSLTELGFKYIADTTVSIDDKTNSLILKIKGKTVNNLYQEILSESEKTLLSLSLFMAIANNKKETLVIIDDPIDSHDEKTKWFIINQIIEFYKKSEVLLVVFTHDLSFSMTVEKVSKIQQNCFIMDTNKMKKITKPSMHFMEIYDFIFCVEDKIIANPTNAKYFLPLALLMRYLSKNQKKLYSEFITPPTTGILSREKVKEIGFGDISNSFVHYDSSVNSIKLLRDVESFMRISIKDITLPSYFCASIDSTVLIEKLINDIGITTQFDIEIITILYSILVRNSLEKRMLSGRTRLPRESLGEIAGNYKNINGEDKIYRYYILNKTMVDDFAHIESGTEVLLAYDLDTVKAKYNELKTI